MPYKINKKILIFLFTTTCVKALARDPFLLPKPPSTPVKIVTLQYASAEEIAKNLQKKEAHFMSQAGSVTADARTNSLWIEDDQSHLNKLTRYIQSIDTPIQQVMIKSKIVILDTHSQQTLGNYLSENSQTEKNETQTLKLPFLSLNQQKLFDVKLIALEQQGHAHIVATPELITNNRQTASIESGEELPYQEKTGEGNTSIAFKKAVLELKVTPIILPNQKILLKLSVSQNKPSALVIQGAPSITTQQLKTEVIIPDKKMFILGGISQHNRSTSESGIPFLNKIPWLNYLFMNRTNNESDQQLMIFITPEIL